MFLRIDVPRVLVFVVVVLFWLLLLFSSSFYLLFFLFLFWRGGGRKKKTFHVFRNIGTWTHLYVGTSVRGNIGPWA